MDTFMELLYNKEALQKAVEELAERIIADHEKDLTKENLILAGIQTRGVTLARRIQEFIARRTGHKVSLGSLGITMYRDDIARSQTARMIKPTELDANIDDKILILIDDVLFTGRTIRAAMDELIDFGRPKVIKLFVLADRPGRQLPIQADFAAKKIAASEHQRITIRLQENDPNMDEGIYLSS